MLKIKDTVSLKELEKFGFGFIQHPRGGVWYEGSPMDNSTVMLFEKDRIINLRNRELVIEVKNEEVVEWLPIDTLYELIQAGLVEKVEQVKE